jgi:hypothetical protein
MVGVDRRLFRGEGDALPLAQRDPAGAGGPEVPDGRAAAAEPDALFRRAGLPAEAQEVARDRVGHLRPRRLHCSRRLRRPLAAHGRAVARLAGDLDLLLGVLPRRAVAHQVGVEVTVDAGEAGEAVDVGLGAAGGAAVVERRGGVAAGARLRLLHLVEPLVRESDAPASAVAAEAAVVGDAGVDGRMRSRDGAREPAGHVAGRAAAAVAVDRVVAVVAQGVQVTPGAELREVPLGGGGVRLREGLGHRRRSARLGDLAEGPAVHGDDPARAGHERGRDPLRLPDVAAGAAAGERDGAQGAGLGLHPGVRAGLVEREGVPEVAGGAADGRAGVRAPGVLLGPHVAGDAALHLPPARSGPRPSAAERCLSRPRAPRRPARARRRATTRVRARNIGGPHRLSSPVGEARASGECS